MNRRVGLRYGKTGGLPARLRGRGVGAGRAVRNAVAAGAGQRVHDLRAVFDALRWIVRAGAPWRLLPNDFPPWPAVYQQTQRWIAAGCFEALAHDLRELLRGVAGRRGQPTAVVFDSRTLQSSPESGGRAGYDGAKRR